jgi:DNA primase large subunit
MRLVELAAQHVNDEILTRAHPRPRPRRFVDKSTIRPCMEAVLRQAEPDHKLRVALAAELNAEGWGVGAIVDHFRGMADFDRRVCEYQVTSVLKSGIRPFRCDTIKALGGCLGDECPIYRRRLR